MSEEDQKQQGPSTPRTVYLGEMYRATNEGMVDYLGNEPAAGKRRLQRVEVQRFSFGYTPYGDGLILKDPKKALRRLYLATVWRRNHGDVALALIAGFSMLSIALSAVLFDSATLTSIIGVVSSLLLYRLLVMYRAGLAEAQSAMYFNKISSTQTFISTLSAICRMSRIELLKPEDVALMEKEEIQKLVESNQENVSIATDYAMNAFSIMFDSAIKETIDESNKTGNNLHSAAAAEMYQINKNGGNI